MFRAASSVAAGVGGRSCIYQSGWKRVKWSGTSGRRCSTIQALSAWISAGESFFPGISSVVISSQTLVSCFRGKGFEHRVERRSPR